MTLKEEILSELIRTGQPQALYMVALLAYE